TLGPAPLFQGPSSGERFPIDRVENSRDGRGRPPVSIADELLKLEELRRGGSLTDEEFARAKAALLAGASAPPGEPVPQHLADQLAEVRYQNELARVDREWETERQKYFVTDRYGRRQVPTSGMGIGMAIGGGIFGVLWTVMAIAITGSAPAEGPFVVAKVVFP